MKVHRKHCPPHLISTTALAVLLVGCAAAPLPAPVPAPTPTAAAVEASPEPEPAPDVSWGNYAPEVRTRIDGLTDCTSLQQQFDIAGDNDDIQRSRTGTGNADLMEYIDFRLRQAGCYQ